MSQVQYEVDDAFLELSFNAVVANSSLKDEVARLSKMVERLQQTSAAQQLVIRGLCEQLAKNTQQLNERDIIDLTQE